MSGNEYTASAERRHESTQLLLEIMDLIPVVFPTEE